MELSGYRAWVYDPELEEYVMKDVARIEFYLDTNEVSVVYTLATVQRDPFDFTYDTYNIEDVVLMKDTGFRDKNGKHIYTKDILEFSNGCLGVVYWNQANGRYAIECRGNEPKDLTKAVAQECIVYGNTIETTNVEDILEENEWN